MKIIAFEVEDWESEFFKHFENDNEITILKDSLNKSNASNYDSAEVITTFINSELDKKVIENFKNLKLICTRSTGKFAIFSPAVAKRLGIASEEHLIWFERIYNMKR